MCLNFWYHNYGASIGELNIYTRKRATLSSAPVWSMIGEHLFKYFFFEKLFKQTCIFNNIQGIKETSGGQLL